MKKIADTLTSNNIKISIPTVYEYVRFIENAYIMNFAERFNVEGKEILATQKKAYVCDLGLFSLKKNRTKGELSNIIEILVFNELVAPPT